MILQSRRKPRLPTGDRSPKMTLEEAATACKVEANWLRALVGRSELKPVLMHFGPNRRYYSMVQIRSLLKEHRGTTPQSAAAQAVHPDP